MLKGPVKKGLQILAVLTAIFPVLCHGQNNKKTDSLLAVLQKQKEDTGKVNTLNALGKQYIQAADFAEAKKYIKEAILLAEKINFKKGVKDAYINSGSVFNAQANGFMRKGNYTEGLKNYLSALKTYEKYEYKYGIAFVNGNIGRLYWIQKNYPEAMKYYQTAFGKFEGINEKNGMAGIYNNIGLIFENQGHYAVAMKYYYDAIRVYGEAGNKGAMVNLYFNIGFLYEDQKNYPEALKNHAAALRISEETGSKDGVAASYINMGDIYIKQANYGAALKKYLLALKLYEEIEDPEGIAMSLNDVGTAYLQLKDFEKANKYFNDGLTIARKEGLLYTIKVSYESLARSDSLAGNWQESLKNYRQYIIYRDSMGGDEVNKKILKAQMQYDYDKKEDSLRYRQVLIDTKLKQQILLGKQQQQSLLLKEQEVLLLNNEKKLQQLQTQKDSAERAGHKAEVDKKQSQLVLLNKEKTLQTLELNKQKQVKRFLFAGLGLLLVLAFFGYRSYRTRQQLKLQTLRNKIASDLHDDVGSTLSSISIFSQMAQQQSKEVNPLLETIEDSSRKMLDAMADIVWTINPENDQFEKIILRMRSFAYELLGAKNIDFEFTADDEVTKINVPMNVRKNLYLIFKEATNNMVKYAAADRALFSIKAEKNNLIMLIKDNGKGFDTGLVITDGNGLKNMKKRAVEIGAQLVINSWPGNGTAIQLMVAI